jgi:hypothetical protein
MDKHRSLLLKACLSMERFASQKVSRWRQKLGTPQEVGWLEP